MILSTIPAIEGINENVRSHRYDSPFHRLHPHRELYIPPVVKALNRGLLKRTGQNHGTTKYISGP